MSDQNNNNEAGMHELAQKILDAWVSPRGADHPVNDHLAVLAAFANEQRDGTEWTPDRIVDRALTYAGRARVGEIPLPMTLRAWARARMYRVSEGQVTRETIAARDEAIRAKREEVARNAMVERTRAEAAWRAMDADGRADFIQRNKDHVHTEYGRKQLAECDVNDDDPPTALWYVLIIKAVPESK